jgi:phosphatidylglycerophosphate synthase
MRLVKQNIANFLTVSRFLMAFVLFFFIGNKNMFLLLYGIAWFTDFIDGTIAKATGTKSDFGSKMDDIADYTLIVVMIIIMIIWIKAEVFYFLDLIIAFIFIRVCNTQITKKKYGKVYIIHTYLNKFAAFTSFLLPFIYIWTGFLNFTYIVLFATIIASFEETVIHLTSTYYDSERKSIFIKEKELQD